MEQKQKDRFRNISELKSTMLVLERQLIWQVWVSPRPTESELQGCGPLCSRGWELWLPAEPLRDAPRPAALPALGLMRAAELQVRIMFQKLEGSVLTWLHVLDQLAWVP